MCWVICCGLAFAEKRPRWLALAWSLALLAPQLHVSAIFMPIITIILTLWIRVARRWRYALLGSAPALLPALPWVYAQLSGVARLGLDFGTAAGRTAPTINLQGLTQILSARGLAANFIAASADGLAEKLSYMDIASILWLILYAGAAVYCAGKIWREREQRGKKAALFRCLALWCALPLAYTLVSGERYTIVFFLPMLPAPCILLALAMRALWRRWPGSKAVLALAVCGLSLLNLNTVRWLDRALGASLEQGNSESHALAMDYFTYPPPLVWQLELTEQIQALMQAGEVSELILLAKSYQDEDYQRFAWTYAYHLRSEAVRAVNLLSPHTVYPAGPAAILLDTHRQRPPRQLANHWQEVARLGPYRLYRMPGGVGPTPQYPLAQRPEYDNGLRLLGYDALRCDGRWQLHWAPGPAREDVDPTHFFVHLLDEQGNILAQYDLRAYDQRDWRAGDHIVTQFAFQQGLDGLPIETIRVGLYRFSDESKTFQGGIYALDERGRPWQYAVDNPYGGECQP